MKSFFSKLIVNWLRFTAQLQLMKVQPLVIGVTGSAGKTSCVQAIGVVLSQKTKLKVGRKGNSETGIPMEILGIKVGTYSGYDWVNVCLQALWQLCTNWERYDTLVLEMGIDSDQLPKNMSHQLSIVQPQIGVLLSISGVHGQNFSGKDILQSIANEKGKLLKSLDASGVAIYSLDYSQILKLVPHIIAKKLTFSSNKSSADLQLIKHELSLSGTTFTFLHEQTTHSLHFSKQLHFKESFGTFASAILVGLEFGITVEESCHKLSQNFQLQPGRMSVIEGRNNSIIIDSSYNSSLEPTSAALRMLDLLPGRKIAVLGDMRELGALAQHDHQELAKQAAKSANIIVLIGPLTSQYTLSQLQQLNFSDKNLMSFANAYQAIDTLQEMIRPNDIILVKGSQNTIFLEIIVKALMKHPDQSSALLCRQTPFWERQRLQLKRS
ncbi:MAG: UDP-N-acetylmuramoyl-tripeptide--D-alanyl-D-alanine ligase [Patescibacteria group bacterium]